MDGDENTAFFHRLINNRKSANGIPGLLIDGVWVDKPKIIKKEVLGFFRNHFEEKVHSRPSLLCPGVKRLTEAGANLLSGIFTAKEIKEAVLEYFKEVLSHFYISGSIDKSCNTSFITLIPKVKDPIGLNDYLSINLIGIISKVISKILANRVKKFIRNIISETQSAFVKDRYILDSPLVLSEI
ncbi:uncharacterized protein LOC110870490 [Helianthus annuus]|uniref:uncharacterized protein LOC110870490 n=1 Tax=Helianthus annuus TaxID=4232 RepID=UPI000B903DC2|nr:uncharacterized protein LOC110870490 [Helianthus annuus]